MNGVKPSRQLVTSAVPQGLLLGPVLLKHLYQQSGQRDQGHPQFADHTKVGGSVDLLDEKKASPEESRKVGSAEKG